MIEAGYLWGLRRKMRRVLVGCRRLIVGGGNRDLMMADLGYRMVFGCENPGLDTVVAAAGMVVLGRHIRTVAAHFEVDTVALACESLSLLVETEILQGMNLTWWSAVRTRGIVATRALLGRRALLRVATIKVILWLALTTVLGL